MADALTILRQGRELIARPGGWTQNAFGRTQGGVRLESYELNRAVSCCAVGALWKVTHGNWPFNTALERLSAGTSGADAGSLYIYRVTAFNDAPERTQAEVVALYDRAIAALLNERGRPADAEAEAQRLCSLREPEVLDA